MVNIIQGGKADFVVRLVDAASGDPYDLTGVTALSTCLANEDGTELVLGLGAGLSVLSAVLGKIQVSITSVQSALLAIVDGATLELTVTVTSNPFKVQIANAYTVIATVC